MKSSMSKIDELGRREFIANAAKTCLGVGLMPMAGSYIHNSVNALIPGARPAKARYVIYLNMAGAMSHLDTFGPKPDCPTFKVRPRRSRRVRMVLFFPRTSPAPPSTCTTPPSSGPACPAREPTSKPAT